jgi:tetratricopeptide (TPR) repeat protein
VRTGDRSGTVQTFVQRLRAAHLQAIHHGDLAAALAELPEPSSPHLHPLLAGWITLLHACLAAERGRRARARELRQAGLASLPPTTPADLVGVLDGLLRFATRDYAAALDELQRVAQGPGALARRARQLALECGGMLGWDQDVAQILAQAHAAEPHEPRWDALAVRHFSRARHVVPALAHATAALTRAPDHAALWMERAGLHAASNQRDQALRAVDSALARAPTSARLDYLREAIRVAVDSGAFGRATELLAEAQALAPHVGELLIWQAELAAWRGDAATAHACATAVLRASTSASTPGERAGAWRVLGGLAVVAGRWDDARTALAASLAQDPRDSASHVWHAELDLHTGQFAAAHEHLNHAVAQAGGYLPVAWMLRLLVVVGAGELPPTAQVSPNQRQEFIHALAELAPEATATAVASGRVDDLVAAIRAGLGALSGNRSIYPTRLVADPQSPETPRLERLHTRTGCRHASRWALQLVRVAPPAQALAALDAVVAAYPGSSLPLCHRGELHLWLGHLDAARRDLTAAIATIEGTRWAYMGLATLELLADQPTQALEILARGVAVMRNTEGPAIHGFRGEAWRRLGQLDAAIAALTRAIELHPARVSAVINLALAYHAADRPADALPLWHRLVAEQAPGLIADAAAACRLVASGDGDWAPHAGDQVAILEAALRMLGGNRSASLVTYWTPDGHLRFVQDWPHHGDRPHARDTKHLALVRRLIARVLRRSR